jgi:ubiquinone/menaquinone biosynthesis C-methylase UbiE
MGMYSRWILPRLVDWAMQTPEVRPFRETLIPLASGCVLEIGVGSGLNFPFYTPAVDRIIGLDPSRVLLRRAAARSSGMSQPIHLIQGSAEAIPLRSETVDTVVMTWVLCGIPNPRRALDEMRRVLRPSGQLLFVEHGLAPEPQVARWQHRLDPLWTRVSCHLDRSMDTLIAEAGFAISDLKTGYLGHGPRIATYMYAGRALPTGEST